MVRTAGFPSGALIWYRPSFIDNMQILQTITVDLLLFQTLASAGVKALNTNLSIHIHLDRWTRGYLLVCNSSSHLPWIVAAATFSTSLSNIALITQDKDIL